ncbi:hypothetical protein DPMN_011467 [Dreissena polymorpha]|uniref:Uncharacterized protein n=1 Tax=Dreissena polymorpha TaxID=45954 RepID=A0A9D4N1T1_DREPO|nr:hypothetical protein DPMN_011467 [Dreissena polymorpha]
MINASHSVEGCMMSGNVAFKHTHPLFHSKTDGAVVVNSDVVIELLEGCKNCAVGAGGIYQV